MATSGSDALVKRNNKLEAFLKRNLEEEVFERIRTHEACIVCSAKEDKAFKYVIISDEWIYLTENPPKKVTPCVHLADVVNIELVNEFPDFLQGEERENTQHIAIHFLTNEPQKGRRRRNSSRRSARSTLTASLTNSGLLPGKSPRRKSFDDRLGLSASRTQLSTSRTLSTARSFGGTTSPRKSTSGFFSENGDATYREANKVESSKISRGRSKSLMEHSSQRDSDENDKKTKEKGSKISENGTSSDTKTKTKSGKNCKDRGDIDLRDKENDPASKTESSRKGSTKKDRRPSNASSIEVPSITVDNWDAEYLRLPLDELSDDEDESLFTSSKKKNRPQSIRFSKEEKNETKKKEKSKGLSCFSKKKTTVEMDTKHNQKTKKGKRRSDMTDDSIWEDEEWREDILHLYVVNYSSPLLILTRFAWTNFLIRATLELDDDYFQKTTKIKKSPGEKMNQLYNELKGEILESNNSMETIFELILELKTAAERNFTLRKLFWKTPEMFAFIVKQMKTYLPNSPNPKKTTSKDRMDQIEFVMLLADTLCVMLRETEVIPARVNSIRVSGAKIFQELLTALIATPSTPNQTPPSKLLELTNVVTQLLYELLLVAHQASMEDDQTSFLNIHNMMAILSGLPSTEEFVGRCLTEAVELLSPSHRYRLPAADAVLLFQKFTFINCLLDYSPKAIDYIRNNFYEEFKYYIQGPIIEAKLPKIYPISPYVVKQIQIMMKVVLQKEVNLGLEPYYGSDLPIYMLNDDY